MYEIEFNCKIVVVCYSLSEDLKNQQHSGQRTRRCSCCSCTSSRLPRPVSESIGTDVNNYNFKQFKYFNFTKIYSVVSFSTPKRDDDGFHIIEQHHVVWSLIYRSLVIHSCSNNGLPFRLYFLELYSAVAIYCSLQVICCFTSFVLSELVRRLYPCKHFRFAFPRR